MNFGFRFNEVSDFETVDPQIIAKRMEERKKVEDSDNQLTNDLFSLSSNETSKEDINKKNHYIKSPKYPKNKKNLKIDVAMINQSYKKKTNYSKSKISLAKEKDIFGEASLDYIDQLAYKIEEAYLYSLD